MTAWLLRLVGGLWCVGLLVVLLGAFVPRLPVVGFLGSFVTGQYPVHAALAAVLGIGIGAGAWATGARGTGVATTVVSVATVVGMVVVLSSLAATARAEWVRLDWGAALTTPGQPDGHPDLTAEYTPGRSLDLYRPSTAGPHPVVVWLHGGSWVRGERTDRTALNRWLADRGHAVVAVEYRLPPPNPVGEDQRRDVACAVSWVRANAAAQGLDAGRIVLAGQSAGATLALNTTSGLTDGSLRCPGDPAPLPSPRGVVAYYPASDLRLIAPELQDALFGGPGDENSALRRELSPVDHVRPGLPPTLLLLGSADHFVFADRVIRYDRQLRDAGVPGRLLVIPYADHVFDHPFGSPGAQITRPAVARFLDDLP
ncbi:acetyl esterase/lipase [Pseudonocardia sediminis]|uniref:Acetyl esterase/lipase n=1 Tax=Pseudonocardia sediminis TaxID=1397368 RepID=A0A4Q7UYJ4_PSEST|nr:alpha/beta hydrolase [Pseudonocardia sediminis]RZT86148.1 acetyl esterase/lipase [Pseudonocardia sediminis]